MRGVSPILARAYGVANLEHDVPLSPQSVFYMASVSKEFTALAILLLEQDGKIRLSDPIRRYIPELPASADAITLRDLLHHTSGLRDYLTLFAPPVLHINLNQARASDARTRLKSTTSSVAPLLRRGSRPKRMLARVERQEPNQTRRRLKLQLGRNLRFVPS